MRWRLLLLLATVVFAGCAGSNRDWYLVGIYGPGADEGFAQRLDEAAREAGGEVVVAGVDNTRQLPTDAAPSDLVAFPDGRIIVLQFDRRRELKRFAQSPTLARTSAGVTRYALFSAKEFRPLPTMPDAPMLCAEPPRDAPAFILLNGITMKKNPVAPLRMMKYAKRNLVRLDNAGVKLLATLARQRTYDGSFDFDLLFLTEWPSDEVFEAFHAEEEFKDLARRYRNPSFRRFAEARGQVVGCRPGG